MTTPIIRMVDRLCFDDSCKEPCRWEQDENSTYMKFKVIHSEECEKTYQKLITPWYLLEEFGGKI